MNAGQQHEGRVGRLSLPTQHPRLACRCPDIQNHSPIPFLDWASFCRLALGTLVCPVPRKGGPDSPFCLLKSPCHVPTGTTTTPSLSPPRLPAPPHLALEKRLVSDSDTEQRPSSSSGSYRAGEMLSHLLSRHEPTHHSSCGRKEARDALGAAAGHATRLHPEKGPASLCRCLERAHKRVCSEWPQ